MSSNDLRIMTGYLLKERFYNKAVLPLGSLEYHGEHLPFGTDTLIADNLAKAVASKFDDMLVVPAIPFGMSAHYAGFPIALTVSTEILIRILKELMSSLNKYGINRLLIVNGHDGNIPALEAASREYRSEHPEFKIMSLEAWWITAGKLLPRGTFEAWEGLGHGGEGETSMMLRVAPELVNMSKLKGVIPSLPEHIQVEWLFGEITPFGVTGDPTKATSEKGIMIWDAIVNHLVSFIEEMDKVGWQKQW